MKLGITKIILAAVVLMLNILTLCVADTTEPPVKNLLLNPTFEGEQMKPWVLQSNDKEDGKFEAKQGVLQMTRSKAGYFMRAYQDVMIEPAASYELSFHIKTQGQGTCQAFVIYGDKEGKKWHEDKIVYSRQSVAGDWEKYTLVMQTLGDAFVARINFGPVGKETQAWIKDVSFVKQEARAAIHIPLATHSPRPDGWLDDESFWKQAAKLEPYRELGQPDQLANPNTETFLLIHGSDLYVGARAFELSMDKITIKTRENDAAVWADDCIEVFLAAENQGRNFVHFMVNPQGDKSVAASGLIATAFSQYWFTALQSFPARDWDARAKIDKDSWQAIIRIHLPVVFASTPNAPPRLFANFCRHRPQGKPAYSNWVGIKGDTFLNPAEFRELTLDPRVNLVSKTQSRIDAFTLSLAAPKELIVGIPVSKADQKGSWPLPGAITFTQNKLAIDIGVLELVEKGTTMSTGSPERRGQINLWLWDESEKFPDTLSSEQLRLLAGNEAFKLEITPTQINISGRTGEGVLRGLATLAMMGSWARSTGHDSLACTTILDAPALPIRGWMPSLNPSNDEQIKAQIDLLFLLRYNTIHFAVDGFGNFAQFPFDSHPNIGTNKTTKARIAALADYARARGINPVVGFAAWSRAGYIYNKPQYKSLAENQELAVGSLVKAAHNKNGCASNPDTYKLINDLYDEIIDTMHPTDVHMVLDEAFYDDVAVCDRCKAAGLTQPQWFVKVITSVHDHLQAKGVRTWVWADCLDPVFNGKKVGIVSTDFLQQLPKDIVINDWRYTGTTYPSIKKFHDAGFATVGSSWQTPWNVAGLIAAVSNANGSGFVGTSWNSTDPATIPAELVTNYSLGAFLSWSPQACALDQFPFLPSVIYQTAAYNYTASAPLTSSPVMVATPVQAATGLDLIQGMGLPGKQTINFYSGQNQSILTTANGVKMLPFTAKNAPAGLIAKANSTIHPSIALSGKAHELTFLHCYSVLPVNDDMHTINKNFSKVNAGKYVVHFADGTSEELPLNFRRQITSWNDRLSTTNTLPAVYGTLSDTLHMNLTAWTVRLKSSEKELTSLEIIPTDRAGMDIVLLGLTLN